MRWRKLLVNLAHSVLDQLYIYNIVSNKMCLNMMKLNKFAEFWSIDTYMCIYIFTYINAKVFVQVII